ncbi:MAG TPA: prohibitin family protein [Herpetosiphonaceae bacterium]
MSSSSRSGSGTGPSIRKIGSWAIGGILALIAVVILSRSWRSIPPGYVGIEFNKFTNQVTTTALEPGWVFVNPFTSAIQEYPVTVQTYIMVLAGGEGQGSGDDSVKVQSKEAQQLNIDVAVQYRVIKDEAAALYTDWGGRGIDIIQVQVVRQETRAALTNLAPIYGWEDISGSKRGELAEQVKERLREKFATRHLLLEDFVIREVHLPDTLKTALDNKIAAQQQAEQQKYQLEQARTKAEQDKVEAQGRAEANKASAEGEAEAIRIKAEAQAKANTLLAESVSDPLIRYQMMLRWDGKLPVFNGGGATPLIDAGAFLDQAAPTQPVSP